MSAGPVFEAICPFRGLMPYTEQDAAYFFGREGERDTITANLRASRLTLLYGPTGAGKTSLLQAGVASALRRHALENLQALGYAEIAPVVFHTWRDNPVKALADQIEASVGLLVAPPYKRRPGGLLSLFKAWSEAVRGDLLVILDQFEEYLLYHENEQSKGGFADEFARAIADPHAGVNFLVSIRADSLFRLDRFKAQVPGLFTNYLRVDYLDLASARRAIVEPLKHYNSLLPDRSLRIRMEPQLIRSILAQVRTDQVSLGDRGEGQVKGKRRQIRIETAYLQMVLIRLWREERSGNSRVLRADTLSRLGGAERIVKTHLDEAMGTMSVAEQRLAAAIFYHLVTPTGAKIAHTSEDLAAFVGMDFGMDQVLRTLSDPSTLVLRKIPPPPGSFSQERYEIFHDVLAPAVLDWRARFNQGQSARPAVLEGIRDPAASLEFQAHSGSVYAIAFSPDGKVLATGAADRTTKLWDFPSGAPLRTLMGHTGTVYSIAFTNKGSELATAGGDNCVSCWNLENTRLGWSEKCSDALYAVAFVRDTAVCGGAASQLSRHPGARKQRIKDHQGIYSLAVSSSPLLVAAGAGDGSILLWNPTSNRQDWFTGKHSDVVWGVAFSPDGRRLASAGYDRKVLVFDVNTRGLVFTITDHTAAVYSVSYSPDAKLLRTVSRDGKIALWDAATGDRVKVIEARTEWGLDAAWSPDGTRVAIAGEDRMVRVYDL
jgi:WD40 repeat protein